MNRANNTLQKGIFRAPPALTRALLLAQAAACATPLFGVGKGTGSEISWCWSGQQRVGRLPAWVFMAEYRVGRAEPMCACEQPAGTAAGSH